MVSHDAWLAEKKRISLQKQQSFINNITSRLGHPKLTTAPERDVTGPPSFWLEKEWDQATCIRTFSQHFESVGGHVTQVTNRDDASHFIVNKIDELSATRVLLQQTDSLKSLGLEAQVQDEVLIQYWNSHNQKNWKQQAAEADIGIVEAEHAIAYTGSVVVTSSEHKGRSVSLLPTVLVLVIPASVFVTRLGEVLTKLDNGGRSELPAGVHFITGPSRSSDIENDLTIGVHGPGIVFAIIIENE